MSLVVNDYLEGFSHNEANIQAIRISKMSILLWARKGIKILNCSYDSGRNSLKIDVVGPGHTLSHNFLLNNVCQCFSAKSSIVEKFT